MAQKQVDVSPRSFLSDFGVAALSITIAKTTISPLDRMMLMIPQQYDYIEKGKFTQPVKGLTDSFIQFSKVDGISSLWKGNTRNVFRNIPSFCLTFATKDQLKRTFLSSSSSFSPSSLSSSLFQNVAIGALAGGLTLPFYYHYDNARLTFIKSKGDVPVKYNNVLDVYKKEGIVSLNKNMPITLIRESVFRGFYFGLFDSLYPLLISPLEKYPILPSLSTFLLVWTTSTSAFYLSNPVDTIRRRVSMGEKYYSSTFDAISKIAQKEGLRAFFKFGFVPIRALTPAIALTVYNRFNVIYFGEY